MAPAFKNTNSSIAMALAGKTASVDIPKPHNGAFWTGKDSFAAVVARPLSDNPQSAGLPTPPNSISPSLPPQGYKNRAIAAPSTPPAQVPVDSDIDLQDAVDHAKAQDQPQRGSVLTSGFGNLAGLDTVGAITPGLLAKHHLPEILLTHGPLAIRHVMGYLTTSVPGFSRIPPAKARRLVVGALEGRGSGGEGGGIHYDVEFEKVGWGRWDAKRRGHSPQDSRGARRHSPLTTRHQSPGRRASSPYAHSGLRIPHGNTRRDRARISSSRSNVKSKDHVQHSHETDIDYYDQLGNLSVPENEADKMSLDGDESCSSSEAPDENPLLNDDIGEVTDEEDWASIGAAALRQGSFPLNLGGSRNYNKHLSSTAHVYTKDRGGGYASSTLAKSMPMPKTDTKFLQQQVLQCNNMGGLVDFHGVGNDSQEREAIEALVRLSSV